MDKEDHDLYHESIKVGRSCVSLNEHLKVLEYRHRELEKTISNENKRPLPNYLYLKELKQKKLRLKEEITLRPVC